MPRLVITTVATDNPMGAEVYQEQISARAEGALGPGWRVERSVVRSMRSSQPGDRRLPMGRLGRAPARVRAAVGRAVYPRDAVVHRMNLELPPSPYTDVITLHDVVAWDFPDESAPVRAAAEEARRAAAVICVSAFTAEQAVERLGVHDPHVVHNGVDEDFFDAAPASADLLAGLGITGRFVIVTGGASRRKNLEGLAEAWPRIHSSQRDLSLVLTGPEHPRRTDLFAGMPGAHLLGRVPGPLVPRLMAAASAVVVPSLHEGFGLPALEGMAVGVPVVAARTSALPEVVGDGGILVEPTPADLAEGVLWAVSGDRDVVAVARRGRARADRFTWERSAAGHAAVWARVAG
jgi:glycosyltransferase involved in cell wall biosynthesis